MEMRELATASVQLVWEKDPATFWTLEPSADTVSRRADGTVSPSVVSVDVVRTRGSEQERVKYGALRLSRNDRTPEEEVAVSATGTSDGVDIGGSSAVTFRLYDPDGGGLLAQRRIPVVSDGQPGEPGADSVTWTLVPSVSVVRCDTATGVYEPDVLSCRLFRHRGEAVTEVPNPAAEGMAMTLSYGSTSGSYLPGLVASLKGLPMRPERFTFAVTKGSTEVARIDVPVVSDGQPGEPGADSVTWTLVPSVSAVRYDTMTGVYEPDVLSCRLFRHKGEAVTEVSNPAAEGMAMTLSYGSTSGVYLPGLVASLKGLPVRPGRFTFAVTKGSTEVARTDVPVVTNGPYVPFPRLWEEYPDGYTFMQGKDGEERRDLVLCRDDGTDRLYACACKKTHAKDGAYRPLPAGGPGKDYWETGVQQRFIATDMLLAELAYIRNLMAEYIQMRDTDGNVLFEVFDGHVVARTGTFENVTVSGTVSAGDPQGKRVLLDPGGKSVRIYDTDGSECARLDGSVYTPESVMPASGQALPEPDGQAVSMSVTATGASEASVTEVAMPRSAATATGLGSVRLTVSASVRMPPGASALAVTGDGLMKPVMMRGADVHCIVATYDDEGLLIGSSRLYVAGCAERTDGSFSGEATRTYTVAVPEGRHEVSFVLRATGDSAWATVRLTQATFVADAMMTRYFGNGLALTKDTENYLVAIYDNDVKRMRLMLGGSFESGGVRQPRTVYAGRVEDSSKSASGAPALRSLVYPGASAGVTVTKGASAVAGYTLRFPAKYGLTPDNCLFRLTGYGGTADSPAGAPSKASVKSVSASGAELLVTVWVSDDASPNFGGFCIEVCRTD